MSIWKHSCVATVRMAVCLGGYHGTAWLHGHVASLLWQKTFPLLSCELYHDFHQCPEAHSVFHRGAIGILGRATAWIDKHQASLDPSTKWHYGFFVIKTTQNAPVCLSVVPLSSPVKVPRSWAQGTEMKEKLKRNPARQKKLIAKRDPNNRVNSEVYETIKTWALRAFVPTFCQQQAPN